VVVCDGSKQLEKYAEIGNQLKHLKALVVYNVENKNSLDGVKSSLGVPVYEFEEFLRLGKTDTNIHHDDGENDDGDDGITATTANDLDELLKRRSESWNSGETCALIYTSGTTGPPKAVQLTHDNITWTVSTALQATYKGSMDTTDSMISYLPLSHIAAQMLDMVRSSRYRIHTNTAATSPVPVPFFLTSLISSCLGPFCFPRVPFLRTTRPKNARAAHASVERVPNLLRPARRPQGVPRRDLEGSPSDDVFRRPPRLVRVRACAGACSFVVLLLAGRCAALSLYYTLEIPPLASDESCLISLFFYAASISGKSSTISCRKSESKRPA